MRNVPSWIRFVRLLDDGASGRTDGLIRLK